MSINRFSFALNAPDNERYLARKGVEMLALLRALATRHQSMALYFGATEEFLQTQLLGVNPAYDELLFSPGDDEAALERLLTGGVVRVETMLDSIRILFIATHAEVTQFKGQKALRGRIPDLVARMQLRESVRVTPTNVRRVKALPAGIDFCREVDYCINIQCLQIYECLRHPYRLPQHALSHRAHGHPAPRPRLACR